MTSTEDSEILKTLFQYQHGFLVSKIMFTAAELGVFDLLRESEEPLTAEAIAEGLGTSRIGMQRLLEACVGLKLLRMEMRDNKGNHIRVGEYTGAHKHLSSFQISGLSCGCRKESQSYRKCI
nr:PREDICTED: acetylserotonin O-methyltransferase-like [Anolis carolinensis]|eukprot:XP_016853147.1 PREDICTED: acetylserotonin O-methyltransferase-like [Anolis carolinensis]